MNENKKIEENAEVTIDLYEILYLFRQKILFIIIALAVGAILGGVITKVAITPQYTSTAKLYIASSSKSVVDISDLQLGTNLAPDYRELLMTTPVLNSLIENLDLPYSASKLKSMIKVSSVSGTRILSVTVTDPKPEEGADIANELARLATLILPEIMKTAAPSVVEEAAAAKRPSSPNITRNILIGALLAALAVCILIVVRYLMDDSIKSSEEMERIYGVVPLATIPEEPELVDKGDD